MKTKNKRKDERHYGKGKENKEHRLEYRRAISGKKVERLLITSKAVRISVQPITRTNKVRMWLQGEAASKVILSCKKRDKDLVIMLKEGSDVRNVELKVAIPTRIKYLSIGTISAKVRVENILPEEVRIKTTKGQVKIVDAQDRKSHVHISTSDADIQAEFKAGCVEMVAKSVSGEVRDKHQSKGKATVKLEASTISGDIFIS